jgi:hypothetical protein
MGLGFVAADRGRRAGGGGRTRAAARTSDSKPKRPLKAAVDEDGFLMPPEDAAMRVFPAATPAGDARGEAEDDALGITTEVVRSFGKLSLIGLAGPIKLRGAQASEGGKILREWSWERGTLQPVCLFSNFTMW